MMYILCLFTLTLHAQENIDIKFESLTTANGLSNNNIHSIYQDEQGYIWVSTLSGLNRYDGDRVISFLNIPGDTNSLSNNSVLWVAEGPEKKLWVKNGNGLSLYNPMNEAFESSAKYLEILQTDAAFITQIIKDQTGSFWIAIENLGLIKLTDGSILEMSTTSEKETRVASKNITDLWLAPNGQLWIVHSFGQLEVIDTNKNRVIRRYGFPDEILDGDDYWKVFVDRDGDIWSYRPHSPFGVHYLNTRTGETKTLTDRELTSEIVRGIVQHENGQIWIGTDHGGVSVLDKSNWTVKAIKTNADQEKSLVSNNVTSIFKDNQGGIWIGTAKNGLSYHHARANSFKHLRIARKDQVYNDMSCFVEDGFGNLWIGTNGKGILKFDPINSKFTSLLDQNDVQGKMPEVVVSMLMTSKGEILVGSYFDGLYSFDSKRSFKELKIFPEGFKNLSIWKLFEDSKGQIWIGTLSNGVFVYNPKTSEIKQYSQANLLKSNYVTSITEDKKGSIWIGTGQGILILDPDLETIRSFLKDNTEPNSLSNNSVVSILEDKKGRIWVATLDGLNLYDGEGSFKVFRVSDGLSSNIIHALLEDDLGNIWFSTSKGITKLTPTEDEYLFQTFDVFDGLQSGSFTENAALKTRNGNMLFSGQNGFNLFTPKDIQTTAQLPKLMFTRLKIANEYIVTGQEYDGRSILERPLNEAEEVVLMHDENSISIEFVALSFFQSAKIKYQYKLDAFDELWFSISDDSRKVNYTNLDPGKYTLRVRASSSSNLWDDTGISLNLVIKPPFWQTVYAYILYFVCFGIFLYITRSFIVSRERQKASLESEKRETQRQHELDLMKLRFFTNISHEFRTPLSLVLTPIDRMIKNPESIKVSELTVVRRNAKRMLNLVNQLLDFRKLEASEHKLHVSSGNFIRFLKDIVGSFSDLSREKQITLEFKSEVKTFYTLFDKDKMEKILFNLLSNAFKFTLSGGNITVNFEILDNTKDNQKVMIVVTDSGIGIPEDKYQLIFNRFYQNDANNGEIINNGTGIGLSITKQFIELHQGKISVESTVGRGSSFIVELPLKEISGDEPRDLENPDEYDNEAADVFDANKPTVMLVEDNFDFRHYLKDNLKPNFNILTAPHGKEAWKLIRNRPPEIVISDVMMPVMDGHELCKKIKSDPRTSHIPVILLTAQSSDEHRIIGLDSGAIEYIAKPFNFDVLLSSINSALKFQERVKVSENHIKAEPSELEIVSIDEQLIAKALELIEANISNSEFSVEDLSHELGYSRGHFYQKILKITGQTPIDFIRGVKMKRAEELLKKSQLNIAEIAYHVGYNNPKLFSRYFKSVYNVYPSDYRVKNDAAKNSKSKV